jgi:hypothetical protein
MGEIAKKNATNQKRNLKAVRAVQRPRKSRAGCTCRTFRKSCDVPSAARSFRLRSKLFLRASVRNAKLTFDPAKTAVTLIPQLSLNAPRRFRKELPRKICATIASFLWLELLLSGRLETPEESPVGAFQVQVQPARRMHAAPSIICSRNKNALPRIARNARTTRNNTAILLHIWLKTA